MSKAIKTYLAVGYNFINDNISCEYVGETRTLKEWIKLLYGDKGLEYFDGWTDKEVLNYIRQNAGYHLEAN